MGLWQKLLHTVLIAILAYVPMPGPGRQPLPTLLPYSIMAMGDSITLGLNDPAGEGYRGPLDKKLTAAGLAHSWVGSQGTAPLAHEGYSGWTCGMLAQIARAEVAKYRPALVLLDCGTNDAGKYFNHSADQILTDLRTLLAEIHVGWPGATIVVAQPTVTLINTALQQQALIDYENQIPSLGVRVVDMRGVCIAITCGGDDVHPGKIGYAQMADAWYPPTLTRA